VRGAGPDLETETVPMASAPSPREIAGAIARASTTRREPAHRRTQQPVRRRSIRAGNERGGIWRPVVIPKGDALESAEIYDRLHRQAGERNGPLGSVALELLRQLWRHVDFKSGRLDPSLDYLRKKLKRSKDAIVRALQALRDHGFLTWVRRYVEVDGQGRRGPQVQQTSNAYMLLLPKRAAKLLRGRRRPIAPEPVDFEADRHAKASALRAMADQEAREKLDGLPGVAKALVKAAWGLKLAAASSAKERESAGQAESGPHEDQ
jgi:biotin operon repressor